MQDRGGGAGLAGLGNACSQMGARPVTTGSGPGAAAAGVAPGCRMLGGWGDDHELASPRRPQRTGRRRHRGAPGQRRRRHHATASSPRSARTRHAGAEVIDADGLLVTPGFVDIHTHFDGQATWDPVLAPSSIHGVTSVAMGNCGVGFAPAKPTPEQHDWLIGMLEGVEDIPGTALAEGLTWDWESFPEYLDALGRRQYAVDVGTHVAHAPLRTYVMGERGADPNEPPTADELATMAHAVQRRRARRRARLHHQPHQRPPHPRRRPARHALLVGRRAAGARRRDGRDRHAASSR